MYIHSIFKIAVRLRGCLLMALALSVGHVSAQVATDNRQSPQDNAATGADIRKQVADLEVKYHIQVFTDKFPIDTARAEIAAILPRNSGKDSLPNLIKPGLRKFSFNYLDKEDELRRDSLLQLFVEEWNKYPVTFIKTSQLRAVYFVKNLKIQGQSRYAMPDDVGNALFFDVNFKTGRPELYLRHCIHHEFYHLVERNYFGNFYYDDRSWSSFNPLDFSYGNGGAAAYGNPDFARKQYPYKGFVSGYATSGMEEDKAELFGYLMTTPEFMKLTRWQKDDPVLAEKIAYMLGFMRGVSRDMDYDYLLKIHQVRMKEVLVPILANDVY